MSSKPNITLTVDFHRGKDIILVKFDYNKELVSHVKRIKEARWSPTKKSWYIKKTEFSLHAFFDVLKSVAYIDYSSVKNKNIIKPILPKKKAPKSEVKLPEAYYDMLDQKRYSESTKSTYINYFKDFLRYFKNQNLNDITTEQINQYLLELIRKEKISDSQQNQRINSIKFYYEKVIGREKEYYGIRRPRNTKTLPKVITETELNNMLTYSGNIKNKVIIGLLYSAGLRRSEIINMRKQDIVSDKMMIFVRGGKGKRDRQTIFIKVYEQSFTRVL